jgi:mRNA interferase MazF
MNDIQKTLNRGSIILVLFPNSDLITAKRRPALIIQKNNLQTGLNQIIIAMITSQISRANHPSRVKILLDSSVGKNSGLLTDSVVMTDNLATISIKAVDRIIGYIPMENVNVAFRYTLSL